MVTKAAERGTQPVSEPALWFAALGGPIAWAVHILVVYPLVYPACDMGRGILIHVVSLLLALVALAAAIVGWRSWRRLGGRNGHRATAETASRSEFMAFFGILSGGLFLLGIIAAWVPAFFIDPCL